MIHSLLFVIHYCHIMDILRTFLIKQDLTIFIEKQNIFQTKQTNVPAVQERQELGTCIFYKTNMWSTPRAFSSGNALL